MKTDNKYMDQTEYKVWQIVIMLPITLGGFWLLSTVGKGIILILMAWGSGK